MQTAVGASERVRHLPEDALPSTLRERYATLAGGWPEDPPEPWLVQLWLSCWARIHGVVSLEVFGHLRFVTEPPWAPSSAAVDEVDVGEQLFRSVLAELADRYGVGEVAVALELRERRRSG